MNVSDYGRSLIRTFVPLVVGSLVAWLATLGIEVDRAAVIGILDPLLATAYYAIIRSAEKRWPGAGWLLGVPGAPSYAPAPPAPSSGDAQGLSGAIAGDAEAEKPLLSLAFEAD
jgi:hypothetical protein